MKRVRSIKDDQEAERLLTAALRNALEAAGGMFSKWALVKPDARSPAFARVLDAAGVEMVGTNIDVYRLYGGDAGKAKSRAEVGFLYVTLDGEQKYIGFRHVSPQSEEVKNPIDSSKTAYHNTVAMNDKIQDLVKEAGLPKKLWAKTRREISSILKRVAETGNTRAAYLCLASELTGKALKKRQEQQRRKTANYRATVKAAKKAGL